ncbi:hypothetical protein CYMTET_17323, partial [Cymbomonas tetramitiformis]
GKTTNDGDKEQVPSGQASGNSRLEAALAAAREVKQAAANKTRIPTASSQKAKYEKPMWARTIDSDTTVMEGVGVSKKHQLALSSMFSSKGGTNSSTAIQVNELARNFPKATAAGLQLYTASQIKSAVGHRQHYYEFWNTETERLAKEYADNKLKIDKLIISGKVDAAWKAQGLPAVLKSAAAHAKGTEDYSVTVSKHLKKLDELCEQLQTQNRSLQSHKDKFEMDVRNMSSTHKSSAKELITTLERECKALLENIGMTTEALRKQLHREAAAKAKRTIDSAKNATEKKRMFPSDTLKRISEGVSARSLKRSRKALPTAAHRPTRKAAVTASSIIENMDLTTDENDVDDEEEAEYVIEEDQTEEEELEEDEEDEDGDVANEEEIIKSLAVEGKTLAVRSDGDEVFLFLTTDGIKEGAKRVPGGFLRELAPGASYGRNTKLKQNEVLFNADKETQRRILELVTADPSVRYFTRYEPARFKRHEWQTTIELGTFVILDDDRMTVADTWTSTAGPKDLRKSDIFQCGFSNEQLQGLIAGEEQEVEKTDGGDGGAMDDEADVLMVTVEADVPTEGALADAPTVDAEADVPTVDAKVDAPTMIAQPDGLAVDAGADAVVDEVDLVSMEVAPNSTACASGNDLELPLN